MTTEEDAAAQIKKDGSITGTMGRKMTVPYGLYRAHGFVSPHLAADTGFTEADLALFWQALLRDVRAGPLGHARPDVGRGLYVFKHASALGNAPSHRLQADGQGGPQPRRGPLVRRLRRHAAGRRRLAARRRAADVRLRLVRRRTDRRPGPGVRAIMDAPAPAWADADLVMISALQHYSYCPRQCGLIHLDQAWGENLYTLRGRRVHEQVDVPGGETVRGVRVERGAAAVVRPARAGRQGRTWSSSATACPLAGRIQARPAPQEQARRVATRRPGALPGGDVRRRRGSGRDLPPHLASAARGGHRAGPAIGRSRGDGPRPRHDPFGKTAPCRQRLPVRQVFASGVVPANRHRHATPVAAVPLRSLFVIDDRPEAAE